MPFILIIAALYSLLVFQEHLNTAFLSLSIPVLITAMSQSRIFSGMFLSVIVSLISIYCLHNKVFWFSFLSIKKNYFVVCYFFCTVVHENYYIRPLIISRSLHLFFNHIFCSLILPYRPF